MVVHVTTTDISLALLLGPQLRAFSAAGYAVVGASAPGPYVAELESWGITHLPVRNATRSFALGRDAAAVVELTRLFRHVRPDIVHTHNPKPGVYGRLAARAAGVPAIVNTVHGLYAQPTDPWPKRATVYGLERLAAACSHAELVQNSEDLAVLARLRVPPGKLRLLGNGVDLARFHPGAVSAERATAVRDELGAGPDDVVVTAVGRLVEEKGYLELFTAASHLRRTSPHVRVVAVGPHDPDKADAVSEAACRQAEHDGVRVLGLRRDVADLYAASDVYVLASHREGFPRSAMEAAAMGLPVVATDIRGCRQVVDHGHTGLLVAVRDPQALAAAVTTLASDALLRRRMGRAGADKAVREFDDRRVIDIALETYGDLLRRSGRGATSAQRRGR